MEIERIPIGRLLERSVSIRQEGETVIIPVVREVLIVEKRLPLKEELHVREAARELDVAASAPIARSHHRTNRDGPVRRLCKGTEAQSPAQHHGFEREHRRKPCR